ncbi:PRC-barrel domain-containing protein [Fulvimarina sp. MAC3]|uniref:PRC-barrel domain-containing protein n=1 Tax=Fulvimarina sp. MAC3 TaxID=3148887 RepID=UPI0031FC5AAE
MLRKLLVSTALAGVLATGAYAQDNNQSGSATGGGQNQETQADTGSSDASGGNMSASSDSQASGNFLQQLSSDQYLASNLTGKSIYGSDAEDAEAVASIDNYLVGSDGQIVAAIVTTSGSEAKTVAVPFDQISWSMNDGEPRATMSSGGEDLSSMPSFMMPGEQQAAASGSEGGSSEQSGMASENTATGDTATTGGSASATDPSTGGDASGSASSTSMESSGSNSSGDTASTGGSSDVPTTVGQDQFLSQNLIGADVVSGPGEDAENIGQVNDLVVSSSGKVDAAVVGVGGFLGIGEKDVAVPFDQIELSKQEGGTPQVVYASDRTQLENAPSFDDERPQEGNSGDQSSNSSNTGMNSDGGTGDNTTEAGQSSAAATGAAATAAAGTAAAGSQQAANDAGNNMEQAGDQAAQSADNAMNEAGQAAEEAGNDMQQAGDQAEQAADNTANQASNDMAQADSNATSGTSEGGQSDMQPVEDTSTLTADDLIGTTVTGPNNESVGDVGDIVLSPEGGIQDIIVDVGGFLGIGEKPVAVSMDNLEFMRDSNGSLAVQSNMTEQQLEDAPEYTPNDAAAGGGNGSSSDTGSATGGQNN